VDDQGRLWPAVLAVGPGRCFLADDVVPVVAEIDTADGRVVELFTWTLSPPHRRLPTSTALALQDGNLLVASPAAGGLVRIDLATGGSTVTPIPAPPLHVVVDGEAVWIVGAPDLDDDARPERDGTRHPVRWEAPTEADVAEHRAALSGMFTVAADGSLRPLVDDADPLPTAAEREDLDDDESELVDRSRRLFRLTGAGLVTVDIGGEPCGEMVLDGTLICVCWRDDDPLVKRVDPGGGSVSYERPATVLAVSADGDVRRVGSVDDNSGTVVANRGTVYLLGYAAREAETLHAIDVTGTGLGDVVDPGVDDVLAIVDRIAVGMVRSRRTPWHAHEDEPEGVHLHLVPLDDPGARRRVPVPDVDTDQVDVAGGTVWLVRADRRALVSVDVTSGEVTEIGLAVDCAHQAPVPEPPPGLDLDGHEQAELGFLRDSLLGGWTNVETGATLPFITGVTFDNIRLEGTFPSTAVVALFHAEGRPGVQFGRRWALYDELGDPDDLEYADIDLMEDVEAAGYGLTALENCVADDAGIVWF
jgi:hypothetical protein